MPKGYSGKILRINLTTGAVSTEEPGDLFYRRYLGGWGFVGYYLLKELKPGIDPLGLDNKLIFAPGIFTGTELSGSGRSAVGAKSPITGGFGEADVGGYFGAELACSGWDTLIVEGKADKPVYISIVDDKVEVKDASHLWGKDAIETQEVLDGELGDDKTRYAVIGKAGENQVVLACVIQDDNHSAGRTGMGAVMGSKNLKAVAVRASGRKEVHDTDKIRELARWLLDEGKPGYIGLQNYGTDGDLIGLSEGGGLPTNNFKYGQFDEAEKITGTTMTETILVDRPTCYSCVVHCKRAVEVKDGPFKTDPKYGGPEYETAGALGSNCGVGDLAAVAKGNQVCNAHGLDTIGGGMMVSFAMECFENGLITEKDTGGLKLNFGNGEAMVKLLEMICDREGIGDLLARGYQACIDKWGPEAEEYALHVKKQPLPLHEPRYKFGLGLGYAVSPTGADHTHNVHDTGFAAEVGLGAVQPFGILDPLPPQDLSLAKVRLTFYHTLTRILKNMMGLCLFVPFTQNMKSDIIRAVTGWDTSLFELMKAAERGMAMARAFNTREGITAKDDMLPDRFFEAFTSGPLEGVSHDRQQFRAALDAYYQMAGWDPVTGAPTRAKLADLALDWVAEELEKCEVAAD